MRLLTALLLLAPALAAAQGRLAFEATAHDLGRVAEAEGPVERTFRFANTGDAPLRIAGITAACGCTTPTWTDAPVPPGGTGEVVVAFDPLGRPGDFEKAVFVEADDAGSVVLRVRGTVRSALAETGVRVGSLAFAAVEVDAGTVPAGEPLQTSVQFANLGDRPVRIERVDAPEGVEVVAPPRPLFPEALGGLFVAVEDPAAFAVDGAVRIPLVVHTTDAEAPATRVVVTARLGPPIPTGGE